MNQDPTSQEAVIATFSLKCQEHFEELAETLLTAKRHISSFAVEDELGRFRLWANNIGAAKVGTASLDYRLRDATYLFQNVKSLLEELEKTLKQGCNAQLKLLT